MKPRSESKRDSLRKRAEKILSQKPKDVRKIPVEDIQRLIHDLDVHQIELDMQNEELRRQQVESDEAKDRYRSLYDFAPIGYFTFDPDGRIAEVNLTGARLLGLPRSRLMGRSFSMFVERDFLVLFRKHLQEVLASNVRQTCELKIKQQPEESSIYVSFDSIAAGKDEEIKCRSAIIDMTDRKQAEDALQESEVRYRAFFDNSIDAVIITSPDGSIQEANAEACRIFGMTRDELVGAGRNGVTDPSDPRLAVAIEERARTGRFKGELDLRRSDGTIFPCEVSSSIFTDKKGLVKTSMIIRDITERKQMMKEREDLILELQKALGEVRTLRGILPICASCKKIRDDKGYWNQLESYIRDHSEAEFSHSLCPECIEKLYPGYRDKLKKG